MMILAFDLAFKYRNPVLLLGDGVVGAMKEPVRLWKPENIDAHQAESWRLDGAAERSKRIIKSMYLEEGALSVHNRRLLVKYEAMAAEAGAEVWRTEDAELLVAAYGSIGRIARGAVNLLRAKGKKVGLVRPLTLYPFPSAVLRELARQGKHFLTMEVNHGQMLDDVRLAIRGYADSDFHGWMPGEIPSTDEVAAPIEEALRRRT
jgi:2-oxoglutarate ferredoxin oxidoreductase subunit alpha